MEECGVAKNIQSLILCTLLSILMLIVINLVFLWPEPKLSRFILSFINSLLHLLQQLLVLFVSRDIANF